MYGPEISKLERILERARDFHDVYTAAAIQTVIELARAASPKNAADEAAYCHEIAEQFGIEHTKDLAELLLIQRAAARATVVPVFDPEAVRALLAAVKKRIGTHAANAALRPLVKAVEDSEKKK